MAAVNVTFPGNLAQVETAQDLRSIPSALIASGDLYLVNGLQGLFEYDTGSVSVDDGTDVIRPYDKTPLQAGRWIRNVDGLASGPQGETGTADNTYTDLSLFKASDTSRRAARLIGVTNVADGDFYWKPGNYTGLADDAFVIKADSTALNQGAWVRAVDRIDVRKAGAKGDGVSDDAPAFNRAIAAIAPTGGTVVVPDASAYRLATTVVTGSKRIVFQIGTTTIICPPGEHGIVLQSNGSAIRGVSRWATIFRHTAPSAAMVYPSVATTISGGALASATATGGSGMRSSPIAVVANSPAADDVAYDAAVVATVASGTVSNLAIVAAGAAYTSAPAVTFQGGGAAAVMIDNVQGCNVSGFSVDFNNVSGSVGVLHRGGWWANIHDLDTFYNTQTGVMSESATSVGLVIDSYTLNAPGANGAYGGVYVSNYTNLRFTRRFVVGHDTSTATTLQFNTCDIKNSWIHGTIGVVDVNPVAQGVSGTDYYHLVNVDALTLLGGDFEDAGRWMHFLGACSNIRALNTLAYAASGPRYRGMPGTGSYFDFAKANSPIEPLRIGSGGTAGIAYRNEGWRIIHRQGIQYSGDTWVDATNVKLFLGTSNVVMGNLDDPASPGSAMVRRGTQMEWYYFSPGANPRTGAQFAVLNTDGLSIGGGVGLQVAGQRVVSTRQAAIPDATAAPTAAQYNAILAALRAHGLIGS